jgi:murein L,D-transpeptidase YafK
MRFNVGLLLLSLTGCADAASALKRPHSVGVTSTSPLNDEANSSQTIAQPSEVVPPAPVEIVAPKPANEAPVDLRMPTEWSGDLARSGPERVAHAKAARKETVLELFEQAGVTFPAKDVLFRVFKAERQLELWAGDGEHELSRIASYGICAASGDLGPKRNEGDRQVPEGFYEVSYYHPTSAYYLAAVINYPNASDKVRGGRKPGSDILIHGHCASIGCIAMTDERIEEIYLVGWSAFMLGQKTHVHIFPSRDFDGLLNDPRHEANHAFWRELRPGFEAFESTRRIPRIKVAKDGRYELLP